MRIITLVLFLSAAVFVQNSRAATKFGFDYWPANMGGDVLQNANWTDTNKNIIRSDLNCMRSYGAELVRLMFYPDQCGWTISPTPNFDLVTFNQIKANLPELLQMFQQRGIQVIICFTNSYYGQGTWAAAYNNDWAAFLQDTLRYMNGISDEIEHYSGYASTVTRYDYINEWAVGNSYSTQYIRGVYDGTTNNIPSAKRMVSLVRPDTECDDLKTALAGRTLAAVDGHYYPDATITIQQRYTNMHNVFPIAIYCGEFGHDAADPNGEAAQQTWELNVANTALSSGTYAAILHWRFWGPFRQTNPPEYKGWGYDYNTPKNVVGGMCSDALLDLLNPDMEL